MASRSKHVEPRPQPRLYLIVPPLADADAVAEPLASAVGAADIAAVLLRLAGGGEREQIDRVKQLAPIAQAAGAAVLIEDQAGLVARAGADGAHLNGIEAFNDAIPTLKPDRIIGAGSMPTRHDAMVAAEAGADYVLFGGADASFAATRERIAWWAEVFEIPCVGYAAGFDEIAPLVAAGADFIALGYVFDDPRGPAAALAETATALRLPETIA
jgi:thiamine-phosphate pyrophosphorylase